MPQIFLSVATSWVSQFAAGFAAKAFAGTFLGTALGSKLFGAAIAGIIGFGLSSLFAGNKKNQGVEDNGIMVNKTGTNNDIHVVYGRRRVAPTRIFMDTGTNSGGSANVEYLHTVNVLCEGEVDDIEDVYFGDKKVWESNSTKSNDGNGRIYGDEVGDYNSDSNLSILAFSGSQTKSAIPFILGGPISFLGSYDRRDGSNPSTSNDYWSNAHIGKHTAYFYSSMKRNEELYTGLPQMTATVKGQLIKNIATGNIEWTDNPADCIWNFLTNDRYGRGLPESRLDLASFQTARAFYASASTTVTTDDYDELGNVIGSSTATVYPYRFNGVTSQGESLHGNITKMMLNCVSNLVIFNGKLHLFANTPENFSNVYNFNDSNIIGDKQIQLGDMDTRRNKITINFADPEFDWQPSQEVITDSTYKTQDDNRTLAETMELQFVSDRKSAHAIGRQFLDESRHRTIIAFTAAPDAIQLAPHDPVTVTLEDYEWTNKQFRVMSMTHQTDGNVGIELLEYVEPNIQ